jgi:hypothetical protein
MLDCAAAQKASDEHIVYVEEDFYKASYGFDAAAMADIVTQSNTIQAEIEDERGVISDLLDLGASLIPVQYRFIYYVAKPFLVPLAEMMYRKYFDSGGGDDAIVVELQALNGNIETLNDRMYWYASESQFGGIGQILGDSLKYQAAEGMFRGVFEDALLFGNSGTLKSAILQLLANQPLEIRISLNGEVEDAYFDALPLE